MSCEDAGVEPTQTWLDLTPSGRVEEWPDVAIDRWTTLREGSGTPSTR